jgi:serine/threonine protein kinase
VFQVRQRGSGIVYAMKVMRKERILQKDHGDYVKAERDLLTAVLHPYIVTLRYSFQTASKLYLVLDFLNGGHLFFNLYRQVGVSWGCVGWALGKQGLLLVGAAGETCIHDAFDS